MMVEYTVEKGQDKAQNNLIQGHMLETRSWDH